MDKSIIRKAVVSATKKVAPAWSLENSVAVNPFLGVAELSFDKAASVLKKRGDIDLYMSFDFYLDQIEQFNLLKSSIKKSLKKYQQDITLDEFLKKVKQLAAEEQSRKIARTINDITELHLNRKELGYHTMIDNVSLWASTYFDQFQAQWTSKEETNVYAVWKSEAKYDKLAEIEGVQKYNETIANLPDDVDEVIEMVIQALELNEEAVEPYLHSLLLNIVGWSSYCSGVDWQRSLYGGETNCLKSFLAILLAYEYAQYIGFKHQGIHDLWRVAKANNNESETNDELLETKAILQDAFDMSFENRLMGEFNENAKSYEYKQEGKAKAQMVFCIDVRSEVYRRNIESVDAQVQTIGFAGFFGFPIKYYPLGHNQGKNQCPVLIPSSVVVKEVPKKKESQEKIERSKVVNSQFDKVWTKFKSGPVSAFSFVSPLGLYFLPKLISDSVGWTKPVAEPKTAEFGSLLNGKGKVDLSSISFEDRFKMANSALRTMGLTKDFAPLVYITGHGASSVNNPHATGLDCGACGGNSGEVNALVAAEILNDQNIRAHLAQDNIEIPTDTFFIAALHNTTTDEIKVLNRDEVPSSLKASLKEMDEITQLASVNARMQRSFRFGDKAALNEKSILKRSNDWSQTRPEWGLSGCSSFIIAPRKRTKDINLEGKAFLHTYNWKSDREFSILEAIMTAPMVVTSWINLQYFASTTDNFHLGAGNKTLHNVTGGNGVFEGARGDLRIGLPFQSIHDGENYQHLPLRLSVVIEAPKSAVMEIINKHNHIKELVDNEWIHLMIMEEDGSISHKYNKEEGWSALETKASTVNKAEELNLIS